MSLGRLVVSWPGVVGRKQDFKRQGDWLCQHWQLKVVQGNPDYWTRYGIESAPKTCRVRRPTPIVGGSAISFCITISAIRLRWVSGKWKPTCRVWRWIGTLAVKTQDQAFYALLFLYNEILDQPLDHVANVVRSRKPITLPEVFSETEIVEVMRHVKGKAWLQAMLMYGGGNSRGAPDATSGQGREN